jgi:glycine oxidase
MADGAGIKVICVARTTARPRAEQGRQTIGSKLMAQTYDIVIVGGGVIGLAIADALARLGMRLAVVDRRELGREASWAGAGLIAPEAENPARHPLVALRALSTRLYPGWSSVLEEETGIDIGYRRCGGVDVAWTESEEQELLAKAGRWRAERVAYERLSSRDYARVEPALSPELRSVYFLPDRAQVRSPWLLRALMTAVYQRGGHLTMWEEVKGFRTDGHRVTAVQTNTGDLNCSTVVIAAGAWSGSLLATIGVHAPTPPVKGQIVLMRSQRALLRRVVELGNNYIVPRDDGRILVGATEEEAGFDTIPTWEVASELVDFALRVCPVLKEAEIETTWAGLRPGSIDSKPYIGRAPGFQNVIVATGHKRAGLQLAPATAELVSDLVLGRPPRLDIAAFRLDREPEPMEQSSLS